MNKPGSIFGSYGSQDNIVEIKDDTVIDIYVNDSDDFIIEAN